jgi:putative NADH-flavin reductase
MKIVVFGATGGTGNNVVERALTAGHDVVAVARKPEAVTAREHLVVHKGDVLDAESVASALVGADAVICAIGPASNGKPGTLISEGTKNILAGCAKEHVRRLVFESGMIVSDGKELSVFGRFAIWAFRSLYPKLYADKVIAEAAIQAASGLEWVIVRPPALNHAKATGKYIAGPGARIFPGSALPHGDCAEVLVKAATEGEWKNQVINVGCV